ncbi:MAG: hypothetical protein ACRDYC_02895 [Acidimicrobiales bacterium]
MRKNAAVSPLGATISVLVLLGAAACGGGSGPSYRGDSHAHPAFCSDNTKLDELTGNTNSPAQRLLAFQANDGVLQDEINRIPASLGTPAPRFLSALQAAVAANSATDLNNLFSNLILGKVGTSSPRAVSALGDPAGQHLAGAQKNVRGWAVKDVDVADENVTGLAGQLDRLQRDAIDVVLLAE